MLKLLKSILPVPIHPDARLKAVGMNYVPPEYMRNMYPPSKGGTAVQNVGADEGYAAVVTIGLYDCFAVALIETEALTGKVTRISMVHLLAETNENQLQALSEDMLKSYKPLCDAYKRQIVIFPGGSYPRHYTWTLTEALKKSVSTVFKVSPDNILCTMSKPTDIGHHSACVSFEGFVGHVDHIPMDEADVRSDIIPIKQARSPFLSYPTDSKYSYMTMGCYQSICFNEPKLHDAYQLIQHDSASVHVKLKLCYLMHKQRAYQLFHDNSYDKKFKQELDALPLFNAKIKLLIGLTSLCTLGAPFVSYYRHAQNNRKKLHDTLQANDKLLYDLLPPFEDRSNSSNLSATMGLSK